LWVVRVEGDDGNSDHDTRSGSPYSRSLLQVREGAITALGHVGNVIKNPEILAIAPLLLESLSNPDKTAKVALRPTS